MKLTNYEMFEMLENLTPHLEKKDLIGYAAARNVRILRNESLEYINRRNELFQEYGEPVLDEDGNETDKIEMKMDNPKFNEFVEKLDVYGEIVHDVELYTVPSKEAIGSLSGIEILQLEWMFTDEG